MTVLCSTSKQVQGWLIYIVMYLVIRSQLILTKILKYTLEFLMSIFLCQMQLLLVTITSESLPIQHNLLTCSAMGPRTFFSTVPIQPWWTAPQLLMQLALAALVLSGSARCQDSWPAVIRTAWLDHVTAIAVASWTTLCLAVQTQQHYVLLLVSTLWFS